MVANWWAGMADAAPPEALSRRPKSSWLGLALAPWPLTTLKAWALKGIAVNFMLTSRLSSSPYLCKPGAKFWGWLRPLGPSCPLPKSGAPSRAISETRGRSSGRFWR
jgi:hypothetical protein